MNEALKEVMSPGFCNDDSRVIYGLRVLRAADKEEILIFILGDNATTDIMKVEIDWFSFQPAADLIPLMNPDDRLSPNDNRPCHFQQLRNILRWAFTNLQLEGGKSFLHIGSESGYANFVAGYILGPRGRNHGLESDPKAFELSVTRAKEIYVSLPHLQDSIAFPTFYNCHVTELPKDRQYDAILCSCVSSESDRQLIIKLLRPCGRALLLFDRYNDDKDCLQYRRVEIYRSNFREIRVTTLSESSKETIPRIQKMTDYFESSGPISLKTQCLQAVDKQIIAGIPSIPTLKTTIVIDWDAVISMKFESKINATRKLISKCLSNMSTFEREAAKGRLDGSGLVDAMTGLKLCLGELTRIAPTDLFPESSCFPMGVIPPFNVSVSAVNHLQLLPSMMLHLIEQVMNKATEQRCVLDGTQPEIDEPWTPKLGEEWLSSFYRQAEAMSDDAINDEAFLSAFDFQRTQYFGNMDLCLIYAFKCIITLVVTIRTERQLLNLLDTEGLMLEQVTFPIGELVKDLRPALKDLLQMDRVYSGRGAIVSPLRYRIGKSTMDERLDELLAKIMFCNTKLRKLVSLVADAVLQRRLCELWWTLHTSSGILKLIRNSRIPAVVNEYGRTVEYYACYSTANRITEKFQSILATFDVCSPDLWTGMLRLLSRCVRHQLDTARQMLLFGGNNRLLQYRERLGRESLKLPPIVKKWLYQCIPASAT